MPQWFFFQLKEKYIQRCREKDNIEDSFYNAKQSVTVKTKELEKVNLSF
jgi:hypothetical protein